MTGAFALNQSISTLARWTLTGLVYLYQGLSSVTPGTCRHEPTCSAYALLALRRHGALRGGWLALRRVMRCRPGGDWGYDPVPEARNESRRGAADRAADRDLSKTA